MAALQNVHVLDGVRGERLYQLNENIPEVQLGEGTTIIYSAGAGKNQQTSKFLCVLVFSLLGAD